MHKSFFITTWRNLWKHRPTTFINLIGLSIGLTASVFIFLWVQNELSFNNYHPGKENIFRITNSIQVNSNEAWKWEASPMLLGETAIREIPAVKNAARVMINSWGGPVFKVDNKLFSEKTSAYVDKSWFTIFQYDFVAGSASAFAKEPRSIILTESKSKKFFGNASAVGKVILVDNINYIVNGVVKDNPINSSFQFDVMMQMEARLLNTENYNDGMNWGNFGYTTFLQLHDSANIKNVESGLNEIVAKNRSNNNCTVSLRPLSELYFENDLQSSDMPHGNKQTAYIFGILGLLLLITACINYVNLTTAKASLRANEVSVRKIIGASRADLFTQFIIESLIISLLALMITLILTQLLLPGFNSLTGLQFHLPMYSLKLWLILISTLIFTALLNGVYPALLLSSFKPLNIFRGKSVLQLHDVSIRKGLVVFQFTVSVALIIGALVIYRQMQFIQTTHPGYNVAQVMSVQVPYKSYAALSSKERVDFFERLKSALKAQGSISNVSSGNSEIVNVDGASSGSADWDGRDTNYNPTIARLSADAKFREMFDLKLVSGRWFQPGKIDEHNYLLNETAVQSFNLKKPTVGQRFIWGGDTGQVIGVVKDFHYKSMHEKIGPMVISSDNGRGSFVFMKVAVGNIPQAIQSVEKVWSEFVPGQPFSYTFLDDRFNAMYKTDIKTGNLIYIFSGIAIIISALGLFGLAAFTAGRRVKEIGIRKVLGASIFNLWQLLSKDFLVLVLIACIIAIPVAYYFMQQWLQNFQYRTNISGWIFVVAGFGAMVIAIFTISFQAIKAAYANPVKSIRNE